MNGGRKTLRLAFILTTRNDSRLMWIVFYQVALPTSWSCDYANEMGLIAGSWLVLALCGTSRDRLRVGILRQRTSKIASRLRTRFDAKTSLCVKKSTKPPCLKRSLEHLPP